MKRILCALLASVMLIGTLAACGNSSENSESTGQQSSTGSAAESGETIEPLEIPDKKYNAELCFLTRDEAEWSTLEIFSEGITSNSDNINNAVFERNALIEETYGVTIKEMKETTGNHTSKITNEIAGSTGDFQAIVTNVSQSASYSSNGYIWDLNANECEYIDLDKSWWDQSMVKGMSIKNRLYFATGDLLTADNDATFIILFNKQIQQDSQIPDLYSMVENKEWTMDKFYQYSVQGVRDSDGKEGLAYDEDISGFAYTGDSPYCFLFAGGITMCKKDNNDIPYYELNLERAQNISDLGEKLFDKAHATDLNKITDVVVMEVGKTCFGENHALFLGEVMQAVTRMRTYDVDFGILPYPMYDSNQNDYYSMMHLTASVVSIPRSVDGDTMEMTSAMIEAMAYHSVKTLTKQYYDINLKTKGAKDEKSGPMIDKILASRACDLAYYYQLNNNAFGNMASTLLPTSAVSVASINKQCNSKMGRAIEKLVGQMDKAAEETEKN